MRRRPDHEQTPIQDQFIYTRVDIANVEERVALYATQYKALVTHMTHATRNESLATILWT